ncbi:aspartate ammonia-lyase [Candidatus Gottesmanbacteria bacterium]|nr:aspartate ammonia-lyase [Candidatus Gottesmanbacteria bacterium]
MSKSYAGQQTFSAVKNFPFSIHKARIELVYAISEIKRAAAVVHGRIGELDKDIAHAIVSSCDEVLRGKHDDQFVTPALQGGAGTSMNMNVNEVIANRATEILRSSGNNLSVHPNDHVNRSQSTNDVNPTALKLVCRTLGQELLRSIDAVVKEFYTLEKRYSKVPKLARTHLQDAIPITYGDEFSSYAAIFSRNGDRINHALSYMNDLSLGGTAVGNGLNASSAYRDAVYKELRKRVDKHIHPATNFMAQTSSQTDFVMLSQAIVALTLDASKIASDIRLLSSGPAGGIGEIKLTELQHGSSIMPGKVNPVIAETVNQTYFLVSGNNHSIEAAAHGAQLELANMFPILADRLIESMKLTSEVLTQFARQCLATLTVNQKRAKEILEKTTAYSTLLSPILGYDRVATLVKEALNTGKTLRELVLEKHLLTDEQYNNIVT